MVIGYVDLVCVVKVWVFFMYVYVFFLMEIVNGVIKSGLSICEWLIGLCEVGLDIILGIVVEILDDEVCWVLIKGKLLMLLWIEIVMIVYEVGLWLLLMMMYGYVDSLWYWVVYFNVLCDI